MSEIVPGPGHPASESVPIDDAQTHAKGAQTAPDPLLPFVWANDVSDGNDDAQEILEDILSAGAMSVWYGESNSGKTYLVLALAKCIAQGTDWLGKRTTQGCVIYVAAEGSQTIERRIRAIRQHEGELAEDYPLGIVKTAINMRESAADTNLLAKLVLAKAAEIIQKPLLVVIDTLSSVLAGGNENGSDDMGALAMNGALLQTLTGSHVLWVHHSGKDAAKGARGHSLLRAKTDTEVEILHDATTGVRTAKISKQRDLDSNGIEISAKLFPIEIGRNQWDKPITACVVVPVGGEVRPARRGNVSLKGGPLRAFKLAEELARDGEVSAQTSVIPGGKGLIKLEEWREKYQATCGDMLESSFRGNWSRVLTALQDSNRIGIHKTVAWIW